MTEATIINPTSKRVLVTGGAGFLGSHLCDRLIAQGHDVLCIDNYFTGRRGNVAHLMDNPNFELMRHDVTFPLYVEVDEIYNLACPASPIHYQHDPVATTKTSVHGAINMLGLAKRIGAKIMQASTSEVYGDPDIHPQPESYWGNVNPIGPRSCYDEGFIMQALKGDDITIFGDGEQTRSFCYCDDLVEAFLRLMDTPDDVTGPINTGNPGEFSMLELAQAVIELTGTKSKIVHKPLPQDDPKQRQPDITLAKKHLDWEPKVPLREGLVPTIEYFDGLVKAGIA